MRPPPSAPRHGRCRWLRRARSGGANSARRAARPREVKDLAQCGRGSRARPLPVMINEQDARSPGILTEVVSELDQHGRFAVPQAFADFFCVGARFRTPRKMLVLNPAAESCLAQKFGDRHLFEIMAAEEEAAGWSGGHAWKAVTNKRNTEAAAATPNMH